MPETSKRNNLDNFSAPTMPVAAKAVKEKEVLAAPVLSAAVSDDPGPSIAIRVGNEAP